MSLRRKSLTIRKRYMESEGQQMRAKIKLTIGGTTFLPGDTVTKKLSAADEAFLLREGYAEKEDSGAKADGKAAKKSGAAPEPA